MKDKNYEFPIISINKNEYEAVNEWIELYRKLLEKRELYIYGAGIRGNMIMTLLEKSNIKIAGFIDGSESKQGEVVKKYHIFSLDEVDKKESSKYILVSPENSTGIELLLEEKGYVKNIDYYVIKSNSYTFFCNDFMDWKDTEYYAFGDCFFTEVDVDDIEGKSLGEIIKEIMGERKIKVLSIHGMCIPGFYYMMRELICIGAKPKSVSFIVNIPFCNSIQTKLPQSQHTELHKKIADELGGITKEYEEYICLTEERSSNLNAAAFSTNKVRNSENVEKVLTKTRYMYELKQDNENIVYMRKLIELLLENSIRPVPFIPALNYYSGEEWFGEEFLIKYCSIVEKIKEIVSEYGIELLDMGLLLKKEHYIGNRMTKFPTEEGKKIEMSLLAERMI